MTSIWNGSYREPEYWAHFAARLVEHAGIRQGVRVLDVGTGWGDVLTAAASATGGTSRLVGIDNRRRCVERTLDVIARRRIASATALPMDAACMAFRDQSFDVVLCGFVGWCGIFDFERCEYVERDRILEEMTRVAAAGGQIAISGWLFQEDNEWMGRLIGRHHPGGARSSGDEPVLCYSKETEQGWVEILRHAGLRHTRVVLESRDFVYRDAGEWLETMRCSGWRDHIDAIGALESGPRDRFESDAIELLYEHRHPDGIHYTREVVIALGEK
jgi:SAM-dependent methyltransferase